MGIIPIYADEIPYSFEIELSKKIYTLEFNYNYIFDFFTVTLKLNKEVLVEDEKLVLNQQLFKELSKDIEGFEDEKFPEEILISVSSNGDDTRIGMDNFGDTVQLYYVTKEDLKEVLKNV
ncbi:hypothetical protein FDF74_12675 [Clostridium niameyense]|uniref:Cyanophage baseplate Pam3 plug gp18 domain-containing protein n=1 Tax=Clostridium niameyense TaxID=1622073 RepID=A0A6M0RCH9_9CLOT|nr:hypothetical protein [Clostridium niameyense]NEZ48025.1 hypothetical protein [Clostridium niameyense]